MKLKRFFMRNFHKRSFFFHDKKASTLKGPINSSHCLPFFNGISFFYAIDKISALNNSFGVE